MKHPLLIVLYFVLLNELSFGQTYVRSFPNVDWSCPCDTTSYFLYSPQISESSFLIDQCCAGQFPPSPVTSRIVKAGRMEVQNPTMALRESTSTMQSPFNLLPDNLRSSHNFFGKHTKPVSHHVKKRNPMLRSASKSPNPLDSDAEFLTDFFELGSREVNSNVPTRRFRKAEGIAGQKRANKRPFTVPRSFLRRNNWNPMLTMRDVDGSEGLISLDADAEFLPKFLELYSSEMISDVPTLRSQNKNGLSGRKQAKALPYTVPDSLHWENDWNPKVRKGNESQTSQEAYLEILRGLSELDLNDVNVSKRLFQISEATLGPMLTRPPTPTWPSIHNGRDLWNLSDENGNENPTFNEADDEFLPAFSKHDPKEINSKQPKRWPENEEAVSSTKQAKTRPFTNYNSLPGSNSWNPTPTTKSEGGFKSPVTFGSDPTILYDLLHRVFRETDTNANF